MRVHYFIFDHYYSGIIQSQCIDLVEFIESQTDAKFQITAFVNVRRYTEARRKYKQHAPRVRVLPNLGFKRWRFSALFAFPFIILHRPDVIVGRSVFAANLALIFKSLKMTRRVVLDARGAEYAEWSEYFFPNDDGPLAVNQIKALERRAVESCDSAVAVSSALVKYWNNELNVSKLPQPLVRIPSTLARVFEEVTIDAQLRKSRRSELGVADDEVLLVFSGAASDWHGIDQLITYCEALAAANLNLKFLFMSNAELNLSENSLLNDRLIKIWVEAKQVPTYLLAADYALLIRTNTTTNKVASPVKFPEYLACGLSVLISPEIGDLSEFVLQRKVGEVIENAAIPLLPPLNEKHRIAVREVALRWFSKAAYKSQYLDVFLGVRD